MLPSGGLATTTGAGVLSSHSGCRPKVLTKARSPISLALSPHPHASALTGLRQLSPPYNSDSSPPTDSPSRGKICPVSSPSRDSRRDTDGTKRARKRAATWQCTVCAKRFTRGYNLRSHLRAHTNERPFFCGLCGKAFARQHDRNRHEKLHYREKRFVCGDGNGTDGRQGCGRAFTRRDGLARHLRSAANEGALDNYAAGSDILSSALITQSPSLIEQERPLPGTNDGIGGVCSIISLVNGNVHGGDSVLQPISGAYASWWNAYTSTHHGLGAAGVP